MSRAKHTPLVITTKELETWKLAAKEEGVSLDEFRRRAMNERALHVLSPGSRLLGGIVESVGKLLQKEPVIQVLDICRCGHERRLHVAYGSDGSNSNRGSCGRALCDCRKYNCASPLGALQK